MQNRPVFSEVICYERTFSLSSQYWLLFLFAVPYGLGAGAIDSSVNNYVAMHYSGAVMNFLHCFYGVGAVISPQIMALALRMALCRRSWRFLPTVRGRGRAFCGHPATLLGQGRDSVMRRWPRSGHLFSEV